MHDIELGLQLTKVKSFVPFYRLRWRFDFADKPTRRGIWNGASPHKEDMAAFVNKKGLIRACIEGEKINEGISRVLFEVHGTNYVSAEWVAALTAPALGLGTFKRAGDIIGLSFVTREEKVTVFIDGKIKTRKLTAKEKEFKLYEHSLGV